MRASQNQVPSAYFKIKELIESTASNSNLNTGVSLGKTES